MENHKEIIDLVSKYIDLRIEPFGKSSRSVLSVEKRTPMYGGNGSVYMLTLFEKDELVNNRIGVYMVLANKGDVAGFHEHHSKNEQEIYVIIHGKGKYIERKGEHVNGIIKEEILSKGAVTIIHDENNYHSIENIGHEPLIVFVISTYLKD